jgi:hypothetical protein
MRRNEPYIEFSPLIGLAKKAGCETIAIMDETPEDDEANLSVAGRVLLQFVSAVAEDKDLIEVAARLKPILLDSETTTEAALRQALFGEPAV